MKLIYRIVIRISLLLTLVLGVWAVFFYMAMMDEVNDEVDDSLEDYSEIIIIRALAGEELPSQNTGSNNQYYLKEVTEEYADSRAGITYKDSMVYIVEKGETEPARILTTIFKDNENRFYELTVSIPSIEKEDLTAAIRDWMIFLYIALLLVIIVVNVWVFQQNMKPLYVLLHWLDDYRIGNKNKPLKNDTQITEFRKLNEAAIRNAERSEQLFEQQKQFIGNASHEIQTPLAICRNRLEMMMEDESLSETQLEELMKTHQTLEYITKLNKSLLLLSKIDNGQFTETVALELNELLKQYMDDYKEVYAYRDIQTEIVEDGIFRVQMNESLATILITNLLKNAFVHNIDGGRIRIEITPHSFTFRNSGVGQPLDEKRIFERFYQGAKKEGSTGLGLAIVDSICRLQNIGLRYYFENGEHCFEISEEKI
ncbi:MAG: sensor histidine kinase [Bacteroides nordii]